jgi:hypothetical protein
MHKCSIAVRSASRAERHGLMTDGRR